MDHISKYLVDYQEKYNPANFEDVVKFINEFNQKFYRVKTEEETQDNDI